MEQERSYNGGFSAMFEDNEQEASLPAAPSAPKTRTAPAPSIGILAVLSVVALIGVSAWSLESASAAKHAALSAASLPSAQVSSAAAVSPSAISSFDSLQTENATDATNSIASLAPSVISALYENYQTLASQGDANAQSEDQVASELAPEVKAQLSYPTFTASEIPTDPNTSYARMLSYRSDLQTSLAPLLNNTDPEFEVFAEYVQTKDPQYLTELQTYAQNYTAAANATAKLVVPADAVSAQVGILNAMEEYAAVLNAMASNASDPIASVALLQNEGQAEQDTYTAFQALANYFANHSKS